jgi:hypothetical protein
LKRELKFRSYYTVESINRKFIYFFLFVRGVLKWNNNIIKRMTLQEVGGFFFRKYLWDIKVFQFFISTLKVGHSSMNRQITSIHTHSWSLQCIAYLNTFHYQQTEKSLFIHRRHKRCWIVQSMSTSKKKVMKMKTNVQKKKLHKPCELLSYQKLLIIIWNAHFCHVLHFIFRG